MAKRDRGRRRREAAVTADIEEHRVLDEATRENKERSARIEALVRQPLGVESLKRYGYRRGAAAA